MENQNWQDYLGSFCANVPYLFHSMMIHNEGMQIQNTLLEMSAKNGLDGFDGPWHFYKNELIY